MTLLVRLNSRSNIQSSVFVQINPSGITANLVELGTSMITRGHLQDLLFDPGRYSVDPDEDSFNASVRWSFDSREMSWLFLIEFRIGNIDTIVESMNEVIFLISKAFSYRSTMVEMIHWIHRVWTIKLDGDLPTQVEPSNPLLKFFRLHLNLTERINGWFTWNIVGMHRFKRQVLFLFKWKKRVPSWFWSGLFTMKCFPVKRDRLFSDYIDSFWLSLDFFLHQNQYYTCLKSFEITDNLTYGL